jgi:membrane fusion protein (multidrug efflux system)
VVAREDDGRSRAYVRNVQGGAVLGDEVLIVQGLEAGEQVAATGSFKLRDGVLVTVAGPQAAAVAGGAR